MYTLPKISEKKLIIFRIKIPVYWSLYQYLITKHLQSIKEIYKIYWKLSSYLKEKLNYIYSYIY